MKCSITMYMELKRPRTTTFQYREKLEPFQMMCLVKSLRSVFRDRSKRMLTTVVCVRGWGLQLNATRSHKHAPRVTHREHMPTQTHALKVFFLDVLERPCKLAGSFW